MLDINFSCVGKIVANFVASLARKWGFSTRFPFLKREKKKKRKINSVTERYIANRFRAFLNHLPREVNRIILFFRKNNECKHGNF